MPSKSISVRAATSADIPFVREMIWEAIMASPQQLAHYGLETMQQLENQYWSNWVKHPDPAFVAFDGTGQLLGAITVKPNDTQEPVHTWRIGIGVVEAARGQGVGRRLIEQAIAFAKEHDAHTVNLFVDPTNKPAIALYQRMGFVEIGGRDDLIEMGRDLISIQ